MPMESTLPQKESKGLLFRDGITCNQVVDIVIPTSFEILLRYRNIYSPCGVWKGLIFPKPNPLQAVFCCLRIHHFHICRLATVVFCLEANVNGSLS